MFNNNATTVRHDPIDSLIYLRRALPLDWLREQLSEHLADADGLIYEDSIEANFLAAIDSTHDVIRDELIFHMDIRREFSTGIPFERVVQYPSTEPDEAGQDVPVIATARVQMHPDGTPTKAPFGGVWVDEVAS